jgi:hypothetical protein
VAQVKPVQDGGLSRPQGRPVRRRDLILAGLAAATPLPALAAPIRTRWKVTSSEGLDAICFLGPLSGKPFYTRYYEKELAAFRPAFPASAQAALDTCQKAADAAGALLAPNLCTLMSGAPDATLDDILASLDDPEGRLLKPIRASPYWDEDQWKGFLQLRPPLRQVFQGLKDANFPAFREQYVGPQLATRVPPLTARLATVDIIAEQERLLGHTLDPGVEIVLVWFSKPHGTRIQGQRFLNAVDYGDELIIRIAAHEILHPPFPMDGPAAKAALDVLAKDKLFARIVAEHDPSFGYTSLEGVLNEDTVQALDQIISERLGVARPPAQRWKGADDGMHVLAAGLYGTLKAECYDRTGGNIAKWMAKAAKTGKLAPEPLHASAARVLETTPHNLWNPPKKA